MAKVSKRTANSHNKHRKVRTDFSKRRMVRLYSDTERNIFDLMPFQDGKTNLELAMDFNLLKTSKRGNSWECWVAESVMAQSKNFPHPVLYVYVIRRALYIVDRFKLGRPSHAVRYLHDFGEIIKDFDRMPRYRFAKKYSEDNTDIVLRIRPAKKGGPNKHNDTRRNRYDVRTPRSVMGKHAAVSHGAKRRAIDAGLVQY